MMTPYNFVGVVLLPLYLARYEELQMDNVSTLKVKKKICMHSKVMTKK